MVATAGSVVVEAGGAVQAGGAVAAAGAAVGAAGVDALAAATGITGAGTITVGLGEGMMVAPFKADSDCWGTLSSIITTGSAVADAAAIWRALDSAATALIYSFSFSFSFLAAIFLFA